MLNDRVKELAGASRNAVINTVHPNGTIQSHLMWVHHDGENLLMNTERERAKFRNIERDPRVTVLLTDENDQYAFTEVRGTVVETIGGDVGRQGIEDLSQKYTGTPYTNHVKSERVQLVIRPDKVYSYPASS
jgi:PPOX class probable F420-dependent enzyme